MNKIYNTVNNTHEKIKVMNFIIKNGFYNFGSINIKNNVYVNLNNGYLLVIHFNMSNATLKGFMQDLKIIFNTGLNNTLKKRYKLI